MTDHGIAAIRELLTVAFDDPGQDAFALDCYPEVYNKFSRGLRKDEKTTLLLDHCRRIEGGLDRLVAEVQARAPWTYAPPQPLDSDKVPEPGPKLPGWRLPFLRNALFTGRQEALKALGRALLHDGAGSTLVTQAVQGMGGVGKTQLAVEFAYRYGRYFRGVHWLNAARPEMLNAEVAECGLAMGLPNWPDKQPEQVRRTLRAWAERGPRLVVLDNLEDVQAAREWLDRLGGGGTVRLLLTARRKNWPRDLGLAALSLEVFSPEESLVFLRQYLLEERASDAELDELAKRLGHLPLALELAGRYMESLSRLSVRDYINRRAGVLEDPSMKSWLAELGNPTGHDLDLAATFAVSWAQVQGPADSAARRVFGLAGWCAPNQAIPFEVLEQAALLNAERCDRVVRLLAGLGLVETEPGGVGPAIHPLLAEFGRKAPYLTAGSPAAAASPSEEEGPLAIVAEVLTGLGYKANETGLPARFVPLRAHVETVAVWAEQARLKRAQALWSNLGFHLQMVADYGGARAAFERALGISEKALGPEHPTVAKLVNNLGSVLHDLGDLAGARAAYERALGIAERAYGPDHPEVAICVNNLGRVLDDLGDLAGARAAYEQALGIGERVDGPDHPNVAIRVNNLGGVLRDLGDLAGAQAAYERALRINEQAYGPDHPTVAGVVSNLGGVLQDLGDLAGAQAAYERALKIEERVYGPNHPNVAVRANNLGMVLRALGDPAKARAALEQVLDILGKTLPPEHPLVATTWNNLGSVLHDLGDLAGARAAFERALGIDAQVYDADHPDIAMHTNNLGGVLRDLGDLAGARAAFERALRILEKFLPADHPKIRIVQENLERLSQRDG